MNPEIMEMIGDEKLQLVPDSLIDRALSVLTVRDYVCSVCWGHLVAMPWSPTRDLVQCQIYGTEHGGFVTRWWADKQRKLDAANAADAKDLLYSIGIIHRESEGMTEEQILKELGF